MSEYTYLIRFNDSSYADANRYAEELQNALLNASPDIIVQRRRANPQTQDFGTTLVLILGTPALAAIATAIGNWLTLRAKASITIETPDKKMVLDNISSKDAASLADRFLTH